MRRPYPAVIPLLLLTGCLVGPDYRRPDYPSPAQFRGETAETPTAPVSLGELAWWQVFADEQLHELIRTALTDNYDLRVAVARVLQARAQLVGTRANQFPFIDVNADAVYSRVEGDLPPQTNQETLQPIGTVDLSFELDLWGRLRRATEAARAELLASEEARRTVVTTLVSDVATAYFQLRELDLQLEISRRTLDSRRASLRLVQAREEGGVASLLEVRQAETLLYTAAAAIPDLERRIAQTENLLSVLLGRNPSAIPRGRPLLEQLALPVVPSGLPSALLERRPDIRQAEQQLVSANAQIGVAKALLFPQVALTGSAGVGAVGVDGTFFGPQGLFAIGPSLTAPIFNAGQLRANVAATEAQQQAALWGYLQAIQRAFREVSDALVEYRKQQEFRVQQEALTRTWQDALRLVNQRYEGGITSFLEVLDTERELFSAELTLARAQLAERVAVVRLYRALGGGWQLEPTPAQPARAPRQVRAAGAKQR
jgi:multidrug efflux system outer membrane protein